jgi:MFS transporter, SP family, inositol transporter
MGNRERRFAAKNVTGKKATFAVAMSNYIEAGSIIAAASSLTLWQEYLNIDHIGIGLLSALSANAFGAALGACIGGPLTDKWGRKIVFSYDLLVYMIGVLLITFSVHFSMLLIGTVITGLAVGVGVPVSWTYIAEEAPVNKRAYRVGAAQLAWSVGPAVTFMLAVAVAPLGLLGSRLLFFHLFVIALIIWYLRRGLPESAIWEKQSENGGKVTLGSLKELFSLKVNRQALVLLIGIYLFWNLTAGAMGFFMPYIYENVGGLTQVQSNLLQACLWTLTVLTTYFGFMKWGDRMSRRGLFALDHPHLFPDDLADAHRLRPALGFRRRHRSPGLLCPVDERIVFDEISGQCPGVDVLYRPQRHRGLDLCAADADRHPRV